MGETSSSLRIRDNGHRFPIERKHLRSSLFTLLQVHSEDYSLPDYRCPALDDYNLLPIEQILTTGSD